MCWQVGRFGASAAAFRLKLAHSWLFWRHCVDLTWIKADSYGMFNMRIARAAVLIGLISRGKVNLRRRLGNFSAASCPCPLSSIEKNVDAGDSNAIDNSIKGKNTCLRHHLSSQLLQSSACRPVLASTQMASAHSLAQVPAHWLPAHWAKTQQLAHWVAHLLAHWPTTWVLHAAAAKTFRATSARLTINCRRRGYAPAAVFV
jgi:hypothetical protein